MGIPSLFVALPFLLLIFSLFAKFFLVWLIYVLESFSFGLPCVGLCASWTWVCFLQQYREIFFHCFFKWDFIYLSSLWIPIMQMLVCLILSTKCLKLSSIFWLIFFLLGAQTGWFLLLCISAYWHVLLNHLICWLICCIFHVHYCILWL